MTLFCFRNDIVLVGDEVAVALALQEKPTRVPIKREIRHSKYDLIFILIVNLSRQLTLINQYSNKKLIRRNNIIYAASQKANLNKIEITNFVIKLWVLSTVS